MNKFSVLNPDTGAVIRMRKTTRPYTHAAIAKNVRGWFCFGFSLSLANAQTMLRDYVQRWSKSHHLERFPDDRILESRVVEVLNEPVKPRKITDAVPRVGTETDYGNPENL